MPKTPEGNHVGLPPLSFCGKMKGNYGTPGAQRGYVVGVTERGKKIMSNTQTVEAIYEQGVLRPLQALEGFAEHSKVTLIVQDPESPPHPLQRFAGILGDDEAAALQELIEEEFEGIDPHAW